ncbi:hypothetical protein FPV67DRAFT_179234 [Lyophyllum atratum]|nr:hypothetical protein FPV67DRAFT_179234 [Lyophyllum atratum]
MIPRLPSNLELYLHTNIPPLEVDAAKTREILRLARTLLYDSELDALGRGGPLVIQKELNQLVCDCNFILSPIRRLPLDVVRTILLTCLPTAWENNDPFADPRDPFYNTQGSFNMALAPWVLSHVSSDWRCISLSTSPLWSHITICMSKLIHRHVRKPFPILDILDTHLSRSGTYPLTIIFGVALDESSFLDNDIFSRLLAQSHRWDKIYLKIGAALLPTFTQVDHPLPLLQHIIIIPTTAFPVETFKSIVAPRLQKVYIHRHPPELLPPL